jgi:hypothetical protein
VNRIALSLLALLPLCAAAQMYKWVDEKGVTHYSETPPPDGKGGKVDIKPTGPAGPSAPTDWKQKEMDARQQRIQKEQQDQQQKSQEVNQASARRNNCLESQRQLSIVQAARPVFQVNEKGEKVYLEDTDRQVQIDGWKSNVKKYCD